jgi:hypothetical protein
MTKKNFDFSKLTQATADDLQVDGQEKRGAYGISVVNSKKNGVRVVLTPKLHESLGSPKSLQFATDDDDLYIGAEIPYSTQSVPFSTGIGTNIIYSRKFVNFLVKRFQLDFTQRTSMSFREIVIETQEFEEREIVYAKIKMTKEIMR